MFRFRVLWTQDSNGVKVLGTIFSSGGYYILDINLPISAKTTHYVLALTSLVILNLLVPARTVTNLRILQVVVTLLSIRCLGTPRLLRLRTGSLPGPGWAPTLSPSLAMIGALCKNIVYMFWSQCPVNGSHPLPIGPDTAQPVGNSSPLLQTGMVGPGNQRAARPATTANVGDDSSTTGQKEECSGRGAATHLIPPTPHRAARSRQSLPRPRGRQMATSSRVPVCPASNGASHGQASSRQVQFQTKPGEHGSSRPRLHQPASAQ